METLEVLEVPVEEGILVVPFDFEGYQFISLETSLEGFYVVDLMGSRFSFKRDRLSSSIKIRKLDGFFSPRN